MDSLITECMKYLVLGRGGREDAATVEDCGWEDSVSLNCKFTPNASQALFDKEGAPGKAPRDYLFRNKRKGFMYFCA